MSVIGLKNTIPKFQETGELGIIPSTKEWQKHKPRKSATN